MSNLEFIQRTFLHELHLSPQHILAEIQENAKINSLQQFQLYQDSIVTRFQNVLRKIYPVCCKLVGKDFFLQMAHAFIRKTPSSFNDLNQYGHAFADFIRDYSPCASLPYLADTAKLEWACYRLCQASAPTEFDFDRLAKSNSENPYRIVFALPNRSSLLSSPYPIHRIWETNQDFYTGDTEILLTQDAPVFLFIWQSKDRMQIDKISEMEYQILHWIYEKYTIEMLCHAISTAYPEIILADLLHHWIVKGWIYV